MRRKEIGGSGKRPPVCVFRLPAREAYSCLPWEKENRGKPFISCKCFSCPACVKMGIRKEKYDKMRKEKEAVKLEPVLEIEALTKYYGRGASRTKALNDITFQADINDA